MGRKRTKLSDQLRRAVETCGETCYSISKATGITESTLSRFMTGERGLPMKTLDRLGDHLDLRIIKGKRTHEKG